MNLPFTRRRFIATSAFGFGAAAWLRAAEGEANANAFSPIKAKLAAGKDAVLFINGDSTSYEKEGAYYIFAKAIGDAMDCKVVMNRWGEWNKGAPTGPKAYEPAETLRDAGKATLTIYLATLPGSSATDMFITARRAQAIDAIPQPDCCMLHHGHNMGGALQSLPGDRTALRGWFFAAIGMTSIKWPGVPQAITNQNPWKTGDQYKRVLESIQAVAALHPSLTLVDTHTPFITAGKTPDLYRNNDAIHPSDNAANHKGAQLVADALIAAWAAAANQPFTTPSWPAMKAGSLVDCGELPDRKEMQGGRTADGTALEATFANPNGSIAKIFDKKDIAAVAGRTITISAWVRVPAKMRVAGNFRCRCEGEPRDFSLRSGGFSDGWMLLVCAGIKVDAEQGETPVELKFAGSLIVNEPFVGGPLLIRKVMVSEGGLPMGIL